MAKILDIEGSEYGGIWKLWKLASLALFAGFVAIAADIAYSLRRHTGRGE